MDNMNNEMLIKQENEVAIIMVPFPAQSHLNQQLQLACIFSSSYDLPVHFIGSATHNHQARVRANGLKPSDIAKIHFHDIPTPDFASPAPDPNAFTKFPSQLLPSYNACTLLRDPISLLLRDISSKSRRVVVVHDVLMSYNVQDVISLHNAESYIFNCVSVFCMYSSFICVPNGMPIPLDEDLLKKLPKLGPDAPEEIKKLVDFQLQYRDIRAGDLYNSNKLLEGTSLDLMEKFASTQNKKQWAIGPIFLAAKVDHVSDKRNKCLDWLDNQPPRSVLYVSFGSSTTFSDKEVMELAMGLERSKQKFVWVLRDGDRGNIFSEEARRFELPDGFEERVEGVGLVVREWAPQLEILAHSSTGGFMSHCGWNSCIECITAGVPMAAWAMHSEQPLNAFFVTEILKTGLLVREWKNHEELVTASAIEEVVRKLMASEEGDELRKRAEELGAAVRVSIEKGGASQLELDSFIAHITR
ncbi:zeatin O-xylosyltransferase-like [Solanum verrucosum]|uniref:zeatin O-xylosyltransferase-like n=1 Tax=Solanum verrucosum TaxID=315347 RepID=UPI0020D1B98F|nr:zeatin O-xylosyltransferase-like [Solanum verrucosum]